MSFAIRQMFDSISNRYDTLNHVLSSGRDRAWRRKSVAMLPRFTGSARALDLCGGTGDFTAALRNAGYHGACVLADFSLPMLHLSRKKPGLKATPVQADALQPPFRDQAFEAVLCAFGMRNLDDVGKGVREIHGLLKPGGVFLTLEFFRPSTIFSRFLYRVVAPVVMPLVGKMLGSRASAYAYLAESVSGFNQVGEYMRRCEAAGFVQVRSHSLDFGVAHAVLAIKKG
jgi:ubiquinone/menaquinone biosynthesis methyltransferase